MTDEYPQYEIKLDAFEIGLIIGALSWNMKDHPDNREHIVKLMAKFAAITQSWHD